jgi:hypothetical protein
MKLLQTFHAAAESSSSFGGVKQELILAARLKYPEGIITPFPARGSSRI